MVDNKFRKIGKILGISTEKKDFKYKGGHSNMFMP